jgi:hypothetical protein
MSQKVKEVQDAAEQAAIAETGASLAKMSDEELELEMKMIKVIASMPEKIQPRFKVLHMLSDERSRINDEFEKEVKALEAKFNEKKAPMLEKRA